jgi:3-hydroxymyristoyl/3-hydroxydecanoyl-(acyl carrier protein) dehydratase
MDAERYDESGLAALRRGDPGACFGKLFSGIQLPASQRLPGGRMALIDRVLSLDPAGGRYGLGTIRAEADIHPDDWFLTCHFVDDMVMPGTLMYECCAHTLRIYLQRMGWISDRPGVVFEPVVGRQAVLKCRGPVTPRTRHVVYEVEICELGFNPEPYVIADAHMFADGHRIVLFRGMTMKMTGMDRAALETFWRLQRPGRQIRHPARDRRPSRKPSNFPATRLVEFATGRPSKVPSAPPTAPSIRSGSLRDCRAALCLHRSRHPHRTAPLGAEARWMGGNRSARSTRKTGISAAMAPRSCPSVF